MRNNEEARRQPADLESLSGPERRRAERLADAGSGEDRDAALAHQGPDSRGMVCVPVGQEYGAHVVEASSDSGEETLDAPAREPGIHEQAASAGFYVRRVARASAREYAQLQDLPFSFIVESGCKITGDLSTSVAVSDCFFDQFSLDDEALFVVRQGAGLERHNGFALDRLHRLDVVRANDLLPRDAVAVLTVG